MTRADLEECGFELTHQLVSDSGRLRFLPVPNSTAVKDPGVYLWVDATNGNEELKILYVGKAGHGTAARLGQHERGFINSGTGQKNAEFLEKILDDGAIVHVYARKSKTIELVDQIVSLYSAEEEAFCARFKPHLNRASFPRITSVSNSIEKDNIRERLTNFLTQRFSDVSPLNREEFELQWSNLTHEAQARILSIIEIIEARIVQQDTEAKYVRGYSEQPNGMSDKPLIAFGRISPRGRMRNNSWVARITLTDEPRLAFHQRFARLGDEPIEQKGAAISPKLIDKFLHHPDVYLMRSQNND